MAWCTIFPTIWSPLLSSQKVETEESRHHVPLLCQPTKASRKAGTVPVSEPPEVWNTHMATQSHQSGDAFSDAAKVKNHGGAKKRGVSTLSPKGPGDPSWSRAQPHILRKMVEVMPNWIRDTAATANHRGDKFCLHHNRHPFKTYYDRLNQ